MQEPISRVILRTQRRKPSLLSSRSVRTDDKQARDDPYLESPSKPHSSTTTKRARYDPTMKLI